MTAVQGLDWIGADWGTSNLRVWALDAAGRVLVRAESEDGMGRLDRAGFEPALLRLVGGWLPAEGRTTVVACGMVGSRQGWVEAPYRAVPCTPFGRGPLARPETRDPRLSVHVIPGLRQDSPADVMRGEETQIAGYLVRNPGFDGVICLPGTHTKWALVSAGEVVAFQTFMTGEIFALLTRQSVLRHSTGGAGWDGPAFAEAVSEGLSRPERLAAALFALRAEALLHGLTPDRARARLSGLLIGSELAASRPFWLGQKVAVVGAERVAAAYAAALGQQALTVATAEVEPMTLAGLAAARSRIAEAIA
ncbi:MAG: 2-dehydro-3-deoxygalactonokinase [Rhodobacteraceae bacterium]|nr:2-dehydro-3-deoxygalactonokinase [Paracoccaceae bacterium]